MLDGRAPIIVRVEGFARRNGMQSRGPVRAGAGDSELVDQCGEGVGDPMRARACGGSGSVLDGERDCDSDCLGALTEVGMWTSDAQST